MRAVLGVDAAWTLSQPSGVALVVERGANWRLLALAPSYESFHAIAMGHPGAAGEFTGSRPDAAALLSSSQRLCGRRVDLVAIDMPLARGPITGRRVSDNAVSRAYGARKCGTHSPSRERPGPISDALRDGFAHQGYALQTESILCPGLIEAYPHPALIELTGASERLPYKLSRIHNYWPQRTIAERRRRLIQQWSLIVGSLAGTISGIADALPSPELNAPLKELKAYEDRLDAIICAFVAICALSGRVRRYGDEHSSIWIPQGV